MSKGIYIGVNNSGILPSGYTQLEYIESSGTQYINTGFYPSNTSSCEVTLSCTSVSDSANGCFGAAGSAYNVDAFEFYYNGTVCNIGFGDTPKRYTSTVIVGDILTVKIEQSQAQVIKNNSTFYTVTPATETFSCPATFILCALNRAGTVQYYSSTRIYRCKIWDNGTLVRDLIPCKNSSSVAGMYDLANNTFYSNAGTGSFITESNTTGNIARKIKKIFVGVSNTARKVKKGYVGVSGVAKLFFGGEGILSYYGRATSLTNQKSSHAATTVGDYALFGGGSNPAILNTVNAYNTSLTRSTPTALSAKISSLAATTVGNYALFGGGVSSTSSSTSTNIVNAYDASLTRSTPTALSTARQNLSATTVGNYALFGGGYLKNATSPYISTVDAYDASLTRSTPTALSVARQYLSATTVGNYALFGGGYTNSQSNGSYYQAIIDTYNTSLTRSTSAALSLGRYNIAATTVGNYALFGGGTNGEISDIVDIYNTSLVHSISTVLSVARASAEATTIGNYALFGGGHYYQSDGYSYTYSATVDVYEYKEE